VHHIRVLGTTLFGALLLLAACKSSEPAPKQPEKAATPRSERAQISNDCVATAEVVAVDPSKRLVTLRREDGSLIQIKAGEEVRNFAQIAVGDHLRVRYKETLTASLRPSGEGAAPVQGVLAAGRAAPGEKPAAGAGLAFSVRVKIESIDRDRGIVVFSLASGELRTHRIATPEGREFVKGLKVGDVVQLDYTQVMAISIEKL
jgi:hypothetical protein